MYLPSSRALSQLAWAGSRGKESYANTVSKFDFREKKPLMWQHRAPPFISTQPVPLASFDQCPGRNVQGSSVCLALSYAASPASPRRKEKTRRIHLHRSAALHSLNLTIIYGLPQTRAALLSLTLAVNSSVVFTSVGASWGWTPALRAWDWAWMHLAVLSEGLCLRAGDPTRPEASRSAAATTLFRPLTSLPPWNQHGEGIW